MITDQIRRTRDCLGCKCCAFTNVLTYLLTYLFTYLLTYLGGRGNEETHTYYRPILICSASQKHPIYCESGYNYSNYSPTVIIVS